MEKKRCLIIDLHICAMIAFAIIGVYSIFESIVLTAIIVIFYFINVISILKLRKLNDR